MTHNIQEIKREFIKIMYDKFTYVQECILDRQNYEDAKKALDMLINEHWTDFIEELENHKRLKIVN